VERKGIKSDSCEGYALQKWIDDPHSVNHLAMLHIFGVIHGARGFNTFGLDF
jgi:hypothetical protein